MTHNDILTKALKVLDAQHQDSSKRPTTENDQSSASSYVDAFEAMFLRTGGHVNPTILRLLGNAQWDVRKAWAEQQEKKSWSVAPPVQEDGKDKWKPTEEKKGGKQKEREDEEEETGGNYFLCAPTTFYESADILLVIMSFSKSRDFFHACAVNQGWRHAGGAMREARRLVRNFCQGIQRTLTMNGVVPVALASARSYVHVLRHVHLQAKQELRDPDYDGRHGGALVPMHSVVFEENTGIQTASVLESRVHPIEEGYGRWRSAVQTLCLSVGRLPTPASQGRVDFIPTTKQQADGSSASSSSFQEIAPLAFQSNRPTSVKYGLGYSHLAVPVLYIRVVCLAESCVCQRLCDATHSDWISEIQQRQRLDQVNAEAIDGKHLAMLFSTSQGQKPLGAENLWEWAEEETEEEIENQEAEAKWAAERRRKEESDARGTASRWKSFCCSLPPPKLLWNSFAGLKIPPEVEIDPKRWFEEPPKPPATTTTTATTKRYPLLTHDEVVQKLKLASPFTLQAKEMTLAQKAVLKEFTMTFEY